MSGSHNFHAKISPSSLERTAVCTASTDFVDDCVDKGLIAISQETNKFAASGTFAHDLAEEAILHIIGRKESKEIKNSESIKSWLDSKQFYWKGELFQDGYGELENYIDYCISQIRDKNDTVYVEVKSRLFYSDNPKDRGTCDFLILHVDGSITIVDLKWRRSGMVDSYQNLQLTAYGLSYIVNKMLRSSKASTKVSLTTYNPLVAPYAQPWNTTIGELKHVAHEKITVPLEHRKQGRAIFVPTVKACEWCPAKDLCLAKKFKVALAFPESFNAADLNPDALVGVLRAEKELTDLVKDAKRILYDLADRGNAHEGTQLVEGRSNRRYEDPDNAATFLEKHLDREDIYEPAKIKSFTKITSKLSPEIKKQFEMEHLIKPKGKLQIQLSEKTDAPSIDSLKAKLLRSVK